jgi:phage terminase small subunit
MRQGTYQPSRQGSQPFAIGDVVKPTDLGKWGSTLWDQVIDFAEHAGAGECDTECMAGMCRWYNEYRRIVSKMLKVSPANKLHHSLLYGAATAWRQFTDMASRFGLTPADRAKLKHGAEETQTTLEKLISNRGA